MTNTEKNALISAAILAAVKSGKPISKAIDEILGEGTYTAVAGNLYDTLRANPAK
jgi:hypothetical protein